MYQVHVNDEVRNAIIRLNDALCTFERCTGIQSVLIIRQQGNENCPAFVFRSLSGKPLDEDRTPDVSDALLMETLKPQ